VVVQPGQLAACLGYLNSDTGQPVIETATRFFPEPVDSTWSETPGAIGNDTCCASRSFNGAIADVAVFNHALTASQLAQMFITAAGVGRSALTLTADTAPSTKEVLAGQTAEFTASFLSSLPISWQWMANTGSGYEPMNGATNNTLVLPNTQFTNQGSYYLVASTSAATNQSSPATLKVLAVPLPPVSGSDAAPVLTNAAPGRQALPKLKVSDNGHFLVTESGRPFFWLGDTAWGLFNRLDREEASRYLEDRAAKGFTVVQAVILNGRLTDPNAYGQLPLRDNDPTKPNEKYFEHVDWIVKRANSLGLYVGLLPTWGDKWNLCFGEGPEIFTAGNAAAYGQWLGRRYRESGLVWILGGDHPVQSDRQSEIIYAMAQGLRNGDGGTHLITFHPPGGCGSSLWFQREAWLDFNLRQNGHNAEFTGRYDQTRFDYERTPPKPVIDGEPLYEDHPLALDAQNYGYSVAADVRRPLYWDLFGGACGHTYGNHSVWQFWATNEPNLNFTLAPWTEEIEAPGASQMHFAKDLLLSRPFLTRVPDDTVIVPDRVPTSVPGAGRYRFVATRDSNGSYAMVYVPVGRKFKVRMGLIRGDSVRAWWFDPRTGKARLIGDFPAGGEREFAPPDLGEALDWVLVLDDASKHFPPPGQAVLEKLR
jgi:hypothetical protein